MEEAKSDRFVPPETAVVKNGVHGGAEEAEHESAGRSAPAVQETTSTGRSAERPSLFWGAPVSGQEELNWFVPPLPDRESRDAELSGMLDGFGDMLEPQQPRRGWLLRWNYRTRAAAAGAELADVEREAQTQLARQHERSERDLVRLDEKIADLRENLQQLDADLVEAKKDFAESAARAGLNCSAMPDPAPQRAWRRRKQPAMPDEEQVHAVQISPRHVEEALESARPTLLEMAGEHGVGPVGRSDFLSTLIQFFMQFLAPLVAGLMLALCLGTLVGLVDIDTLQRADGAPQLALCAALGFVIVYLLGEVYHAAVSALARSLEARQQWEGGSHLPVPRLRGALGLAITLSALAGILGLAEITAESLGIRQLHSQQIARQQRFRSAPLAGGAATEMPLVVYMLIGTLISGPYLVYKSARAWSENESQLREAWLTHRQRIWLEERRAEQDVQQTFHHAYVVEHLENGLRAGKARLQEAEDERARALQVELSPAMQARRQAARAAAVGEAARMQQTLEGLVDATEPMPERSGIVAAKAGRGNRFGGR